MQLLFEHPVSRMRRKSVMGFSWTTLFFGFFPALFRQHWAGAIIQFICAMFTFGLSNLFFCFMYNRWHCESLSHDGYDLFLSHSDAKKVLGRYPFVNVYITKTAEEEKKERELNAAMKVQYLEAWNDKNKGHPHPINLGESMAILAAFSVVVLVAYLISR